MPSAADRSDDGRHETPAERADRNLSELLQELRVAAQGVQVLFAFLLVIPFDSRFTHLDPPERHLYTATLVLAALSMALMTAPTAFHRLVFRRHEKERLVTVSNAMAIGGLATLGLAVGCGVWLVVGFVASGWPAGVLAGGFVASLVILWVVAPLVGRALSQGASQQPRGRHGGS